MASRCSKANNIMKKSFKILGAFTFLIALTIAFSAFKANTKKARALQYWEYSGLNSATDQNEYTPASAPSCAEGANVVCTILAEEDPMNLGRPKIEGEDIETRIQSKDEGSGDVFVRN